MKKYIIEEIRKYIISHSVGDILYNLYEENIEKAQKKEKDKRGYSLHDYLDDIEDYTNESADLDPHYGED